jgi:DNA polymerase-3 subunit epsilon
VGAIDVETYGHQIEAVRTAIQSDPSPVIDALVTRIKRLAGHERFEEAASHRDRMAAFIRAAARTQRMVALARCPQLVGAIRGAEGGWEIHVIRYGRLAGAGVAPSGTPPLPVIEQIVASAETVAEPPLPKPAATAEETERILAWLETPGVRLVELDGEWSCPISGAQSHLDWLSRAYEGRETFANAEDRRGLRTMHRPPR